MYVASIQVTFLNCDCWDRQHPSTYSATSLLLFLDAKANSAPIMPANMIKANTSTDTTEMVRTVQAESTECQVMKLHMMLHLKLCLLQNATCTEGLLSLCLPSLILL